MASCIPLVAETAIEDDPLEPADPLKPVEPTVRANSVEPQAGLWVIIDGDSFTESEGASLRKTLTEAFQAAERYDLLPLYGFMVGGLADEEQDELTRIINELKGVTDEVDPAQLVPAEEALALAVGRMYITIRLKQEKVLSNDEILFEVSCESVFWSDANTHTLKKTVFGTGKTREEAWVTTSQLLANHIVTSYITFINDSEHVIVQKLAKNTLIANFTEPYKAGQRFYVQRRLPGGKIQYVGFVELLGDVEAGNSQEVLVFHIINPGVGAELVSGANRTLDITTYYSFPIVGEEQMVIQEVRTSTPISLFDALFWGVEVAIPTTPALTTSAGTSSVAGTSSATGTSSAAGTSSATEASSAGFSAMLRAIGGADFFAWSVGTTRVVFSGQAGFGYRFNHHWNWHMTGRLGLRVEAFLGNRTILTIGGGVDGGAPFSVDFNGTANGLRLGGFVSLGVNVLF